MCPPGMAISVGRVDEQKREIASCLAMTDGGRFESAQHPEGALTENMRGNRKERLLRRLAEIASQARNDKITLSSRVFFCYRERSAKCPPGMAISVVRVGEQKREIASCLATTH